MNCIQPSQPLTLSILTPALPSRLAMVQRLATELEQQIFDRPVEHLILLDNKRRTVGEKRDALLRVARGKYLAFCDDDDWVAHDYVQSILKAAQDGPDVITFRQHCTVDGQEGEIDFGLGNKNEAFKPGSTALRNAWHVCAWRRALAILSHFPACNYGEDWAYAGPLCALPHLKEAHIDKVLHFYQYDSHTSQAPPPGLTAPQ
jgi:hypothetical protein